MKIFLSLVFPILGEKLIFNIRYTPWLNQVDAVWQYKWFILGYIIFVLTKKYKNISKLFLTKVALAFSIVGIIVSWITFCKINLNENIVCVIATVSIILLFRNIAQLCNEKILKFIGNIGINTLPIYAIHWCILFAPNLYVNRYTAILNENFYILNVIFTAIIWIAISMVCIWALRKSKVTRVLFLGEK